MFEKRRFPAPIGAAAISFLMSFEDFNITLMLGGSDTPLTEMMYAGMREGRHTFPQCGEPDFDDGFGPVGPDAAAPCGGVRRNNLIVHALPALASGTCTNQ